MKKIAIINGPNLDRLGVREPEIYGKTKLSDIIDSLKKRAAQLGFEIEAFQSNSEGEIIDKIYEFADAGVKSVTPEEASDLLRSDLAPLEQALRVLITVPLKQCQYDALCDYIFTVGIARFKKGKVLKALNKGNFTLAATEIRFTLPDKASSRLIRRREAEYTLFTGKEPHLPPLSEESL